jgi:hypothetical protein
LQHFLTQHVQENNHIGGQNKKVSTNQTSLTELISEKNEKKIKVPVRHIQSSCSSKHSLEHNKKWKFKIFIGKMLQPIHSSQAAIMTTLLRYPYSTMTTAL